MLNNEIPQLLQRVRLAMAERDWRTATQLCIEVLKRDQRQPDAHLVLGLAAAEAGKLDMALRAFDTALQIDPGRSDARVQRARCLVQAGRHLEAEVEADRCADQFDDNAKQLDLLATVYSHLGKQDKAAPLYQRALELSPDDVIVLSNAAAVFLFIGNKKAAERCLERALELQPDNYRCHWQLAKLRRAQTPDHSEAMTQLAAQRHEDSRAQTFLHYAIGKECEDLGYWPQAWKHYRLGAEAQRGRITYDGADDLRLFQTLQRRFDARWFAGIASNRSVDTESAPIFILSLPRSGSTLVEQIIGSHSQVQPLGELPQWPLAVKQLSGIRQPGLFRADIASEAASIDPDRLAALYLENIRHLRHSQPRFTDKLPNNFLYTGLLAKAFPRAHFVHVQRNPMDSCFAMYKQLFADAYPFSYTQRELADYYVQYRQLMDHWQELLGERLYNLNYDQLVQDQKAETEKLLRHLELPFEEGCLASHQSTSAAATASAAQVRQPVHARSVGRWHHFAAELEELRERLQQADIAVE